MRYGLGVKLAVPLLATLAAGFGVLLYVSPTLALAQSVAVGIRHAMLSQRAASVPPDERPKWPSHSISKT